MKNDKFIDRHDIDVIDEIGRPEMLNSNLAEAVNPLDSDMQAILSPVPDPILIDTDKVGRAEISDTSPTNCRLTLDEEVERDINDCDRINGTESLFAQSDKKVRMALVPAYRPFRRAMADLAYRRTLASHLFDQAGGARKPSEKKPWCLAARLALRPKTEDEVARTYEAAYYLRHAAIDDVPVSEFESWIERQGQKASRAYVRNNRKLADDNTANKRQSPYPNIARAKKIKGDSDIAGILKSAFDLAEAELGEHFARKNLNDA